MNFLGDVQGAYMARSVTCESHVRGDQPAQCCGISSRRKPFSSPDSHHLRAAQGWLELGNHLEADKELDEITPQLRTHPDVLEVRWHIYAHAEKWEASVWQNTFCPLTGSVQFYRSCSGASNGLKLA